MITKACLIQYDEQTDVRSEIEELDEDELGALNDAEGWPGWSLFPGLLGWGPYTHTLSLFDPASLAEVGLYDDYGGEPSRLYYHVAIA